MHASESVSASVELNTLPKMNRFRKIFNREPAYQSLENGEAEYDGDIASEDGLDQGLPNDHDEFSWLEYSIFLLLGMAMLWAWYFYHIHLST